MIIIEAKTSLWRYAAIAFGLLVLLYLFCGANVPGKGNGADSVRNEIDAAGTANQELQDRLELVEGGANSIAEKLDDSKAAISRAENAAQRIGENLDRAAELNRECQQIIQRVRQRNEAERATD